MINNKANNCYYFAVKNFPELYSQDWLRCKKVAIIDRDDLSLEAIINVLDDALDYQNIERDP